MKNNLLLTIGIPTWNRCNLLREMILSVCNQADRQSLYEQIELVVFDNDSEDATQITIEEIQESTKTTIRYYKNEKNIGPVRNVLKTLEAARGKFWMFYGDDDLMADNALPSIIKTFQEHSETPVFLFNQKQHYNVLNMPVHPSGESYIKIEDAMKNYFYFVGNAGVFALKTDIAKQVCSEFNVAVIPTLWPQTLLAFLTMFKSQITKPTYLSSIISVNSPNHMKNTFHSSWYILQTKFLSFYEIVKLLSNVLDLKTCTQLKTDLVFSKKTINDLRVIFLLLTYADSEEQRRQTRMCIENTIIKSPSKESFFFLSAIWVMSVLPQSINRMLYSLSIYIRFPFKAKQKINEIKQSYSPFSTRTESSDFRVYSPDDYIE